MDDVVGDDPAGREVVQAGDEAEIIFAAGEVGLTAAEIQRHGDGRHEHHISSDAGGCSGRANQQPVARNLQCVVVSGTCKVSL